MARVKSRDTSPERRVRSLLHRLGFRFRLHRKDLPGSPDIVLPRHRVAILVHGCFWHGHDCRRGARQPATNADYWRAKIQRNRERDFRTVAALTDMSWRVIVVWECELKQLENLGQKLLHFIKRPHN
jgi:DNA mismatch endonuclease (patch repair protein)